MLKILPVIGILFVVVVFMYGIERVFTALIFRRILKKSLQSKPYCAGCGSIMVPDGSCFKCLNCGEKSGCS